MPTSSSTSSRVLVPEIDLLRAVAAMLVLIGHARNLFFVDYYQIKSPGWWHHPLYFITGLGAESVMIFFVLSGLLVGGRALNTINGGRWSWKIYLIARLSRLCIVLWPALLTTYLLDSLGMAVFGRDNIYGGINHGSNVIPIGIEQVTTLKIYFDNAVFLQGLTNPTAGSNRALWSLSNEFWYYIAFPALALSLKSGFRLSTRIIALAILWGTYRLAGSFGGGFITWLMGAFCAAYSRRYHWMRESFIFGAAILLLGALAISRAAPTSYTQQLVGLFTMILCFALLGKQPTLPTTVLKMAHRFSSISYSLYLTHLPMIVFIRAAFPGPRWQPEIRYVVAAGGICGLATLWGLLSYRLTEYYTPQLRRHLLNLFGSRRKAEPAQLSKAA